MGRSDNALLVAVRNVFQACFFAWKVLNVLMSSLEYVAVKVFFTSLKIRNKQQIQCRFLVTSENNSRWRNGLKQVGKQVFLVYK